MTMVERAEDILRNKLSRDNYRVLWSNNEGFTAEVEEPKCKAIIAYQSSPTVYTIALVQPDNEDFPVTFDSPAAKLVQQWWNPDLRIFMVRDGDAIDTVKAILAVFLRGGTIITDEELQRLKSKTEHERLMRLDAEERERLASALEAQKEELARLQAERAELAKERKQAKKGTTLSPIEIRDRAFTNMLTELTNKGIQRRTQAGKIYVKRKHLSAVMQLDPFSNTVTWNMRFYRTEEMDDPGASPVVLYTWQRAKWAKYYNVFTNTLEAIPAWDAIKILENILCE